MSVSYVGSTGYRSTGSTSVTISTPSGVQPGDFLIIVGAADPAGSWSGSGWTFVSGTNTDFVFMYRVVDSTNPASYSITAPNTSGRSLLMLAYRGVKAGSPPSQYGTGTIASSGTSVIAAPALAVTSSADRLLIVWGGQVSKGASATPEDANLTKRYNVDSVYTSTQLLGAADGPGAASHNYNIDVQATYSSTAMLRSIQLISANQAPNAPSWVTPQNSNIPADQDAYIELAFSDPDPGDSMSASNWKRWALDASGNRVGAAVATYQPTPSTQLLIPAGTLTAGTKYEFQADTLDSQGAEGPYSASLFVTAQNTPGAPTITDPTSGATIGTSSQTFTISTPSLQESEWTLYADDGAGGIDTSTILQGPVSVTTGDLRSHTFTGLVNNVPVWASVRIKDGGLWSQPRQQRNPVSYTPPASPVITLTPDAANGALVVGITNPAPGAGEPATSYNNVYVDDGKGAGKERVATNLPTNQPWTYPWPVSLRDYTGNLWVEAVATNGTTAETVA